MQDRLTQLLFECVREYGEEAGTAVEVQRDSPLIGDHSPVDSLGLVMIVTSFEAKVNEAFGAEIVLANEKAMSMKSSPFRSIAALSEYAGELLTESGRV
jgi:acyl carrier protein